MAMHELSFSLQGILDSTPSVHFLDHPPPLYAAGKKKQYTKTRRRKSNRDRERESKIKASDCHSEELFFSGAGKNFIGLGILTDH
jgi:hypothetical protein